MKYRRLGKTDLELSEVGFGVWTVSTRDWGKLDERESMTLLSQALDVGISFFDTADAHGDGYGEEILAKALGKHRNSMVIGTKVGYDFYTQDELPGQQGHPQNFSPSYVRYACEQSLRRLKTDYIDLYQLHNPGLASVESDDLFEALEMLVKEGKIRYYGCALGPDADWSEKAEVSMKNRRVSSVQITYSLLEQEYAKRVFPAAEEKDTGLLSRDPHASGVLDGTYDKHTVQTPPNHERQAWLDGDLKRVERLKFLTQDTDATMSQIAIKFALARGYIACVLPDITNQQQLLEFAFAPEITDLSAEALEQIDDLYDNDFYLEESS